MATTPQLNTRGLGYPAISTPADNSVRTLTQIISNIRQRIANIESNLTTASQTANQTVATSSGGASATSLLALQSQLAQLTAAVAALAAEAADANFVLGTEVYSRRAVQYIPNYTDSQAIISARVFGAR